MDTASANICLMFLRLSAPSSLLHLVTLHNASQSVLSIEGSVHPSVLGCLQGRNAPATAKHELTRATDFMVVIDTPQILVPKREFLRIRGAPCHCAGPARSDQFNQVLELCLSSRRRSTPFLVHAIHFIVLQQVVLIFNLTETLRCISLMLLPLCCFPRPVVRRCLLVFELFLAKFKHCWSCPVSLPSPFQW